MVSSTSIIIMIIGTALLGLWLFLFFTSSKYDEMFDTLDEKDFQYKEIYRVGARIMELSKYRYNSKSDRKMRQQLTILYSQKEAEFYLRVVYAQRATMASVILLFAFPVYAFSESVLFLLLVVGLAGFSFYYYGTLIQERIDERNENIINEFCQAVSKLALLTNAGATLKDAWKQVAEEGEGLIYDEMKFVVSELKNGTSDVDAFYQFGTRCNVLEVKKFSSIVIQGISKGNRELSIMLQDQSNELWQLKKHLVKRQAEKANSKLLIPMCLMFVGVLIMVIVPIFSNIGV